MSQPPDRAATILARFNAAQNSLASKLRALPAAVAEERPAPDAWSAAQIGWHVAIVNEYLAGVLMGSKPGAEPAPPGFKESFDPEKLRTVGHMGHVREYAGREVAEFLSRTGFEIAERHLVVYDRSRSGRLVDVCYRLVPAWRPYQVFISRKRTQH